MVAPTNHPYYDDYGQGLDVTHNVEAVPPGRHYETYSWRPWARAPAARSRRRGRPRSTRPSPRSGAQTVAPTGKGGKYVTLVRARCATHGSPRPSPAPRRRPRRSSRSRSSSTTLSSRRSRSPAKGKALGVPLADNQTAEVTAEVDAPPEEEGQEGQAEGLRGERLLRGVHHLIDQTDRPVYRRLSSHRQAARCIAPGPVLFTVRPVGYRPARERGRQPGHRRRVPAGHRLRPRPDHAGGRDAGARADRRPLWPVEPGRYRLVAARACPWASRAIIVRACSGSRTCISLGLAGPTHDERSWTFDLDPDGRDPVLGIERLQQAYFARYPAYEKGITVPAMVDVPTGQVVTNDFPWMTHDLLHEWREHHRPGAPDLWPEDLRDEMDEVMERVYTEVNNGVYRCGFASSQQAYDAAYDRLWESLDGLEERLTDRRYLMGEAITEADVRLFTTLVRFDAVYHGHFKCNRQKLTEMPVLWGYARDLFQTPGFGETVDFDQIKRHYYVRARRHQPDRDRARAVPDRRLARRRTVAADVEHWSPPSPWAAPRRMGTTTLTPPGGPRTGPAADGAGGHRHGARARADRRLGRGSLALLADAGHMATDTAAVVLALGASYVATRRRAALDVRPAPGRDPRRAGQRRGAARRLRLPGLRRHQPARAPEHVEPGRWSVRRGRAGGQRRLDGGADRSETGSLNMRGAINEVLADLLGSVLAVVAGVVIWSSGFTRADPIASLLIAVLILPRSLRLLGTRPSSCSRSRRRASTSRTCAPTCSAYPVSSRSTTCTPGRSPAACRPSRPTSPSPTPRWPSAVSAPSSTGSACAPPSTSTSATRRSRSSPREPSRARGPRRGATVAT